MSKGDIMTTINTYSHVIPSFGGEMAPAIVDVLGEKGDPPRGERPSPGGRHHIPSALSLGLRRQYQSDGLIENPSLYFGLVVLIPNNRKDGMGGALEAGARQRAKWCLSSRRQRAQSCKHTAGGRPPVAAFVVDSSSEIVTIVDPDGTLRYASPAFGRVLGYDPEEAIGTM